MNAVSTAFFFLQIARIIRQFSKSSEIGNTTSLVLTQKKTAPFGSGQKWWPDQESNQGHKDFQSSALPTELSGQKLKLLLHFK